MKTDISRVGTAPQVMYGWLGLMAPAHGENCPLDNVEIPPHQGTINYHPLMRSSSTLTQLQQPGDENGHPPAPQDVDTHPHGLISYCLGSWSQHAARVAPPDKVEVPPHPGTIIQHPLIINVSLHLQHQQFVDENGHPTGRYCPAKCGAPSPTG